MPDNPWVGKIRYPNLPWCNSLWHATNAILVSTHYTNNVTSILVYWGMNKCRWHSEKHLLEAKVYQFHWALLNAVGIGSCNGVVPILWSIEPRSLLYICVIRPQWIILFVTFALHEGIYHVAGPLWGESTGHRDIGPVMLALVFCFMLT